MPLAFTAACFPRTATARLLGDQRLERQMDGGLGADNQIWNFVQV
jgi:hypothetical protein